MTSTRRQAGAAAFAVLLLSACSSTPAATPSSPGSSTVAAASQAVVMCQKALRGQQVVSAGPLVTVSVVRGTQVGPGNSTPWAKAFPGQDGGASAAWCWTKGSDGYKGFAVTGDGTSVPVGTDLAEKPAPSGPPITL